MKLPNPVSRLQFEVNRFQQPCFSGFLLLTAWTTSHVVAKPSFWPNKSNLLPFQSDSSVIHLCKTCNLVAEPYKESFIAIIEESKNFRQQNCETGSNSNNSNNRNNHHNSNNRNNKLKSAEAILAQKKLYQKHLRTLQQSSLARDVLQSNSINYYLTTT